MKINQQKRGGFVMLVSSVRFITDFFFKVGSTSLNLEQETSSNEFRHIGRRDFQLEVSHQLQEAVVQLRKRTNS